ncbi:fused MFS/spermidine synthase [Zavarzinia sp. CC-PAN008]|uniref:fused MFS/spermidine synthase n=1 Tax=Zavarzinia sp. CC-PAN008 TaxID=3243332 RepID=UPI003F744AEE
MSGAQGRPLPAATRAIVFLSAIVFGTVTMGFEMVAVRYLNPYFGSGIVTWAAIIAVVLLAMMIGYFVGGALVDRYPTFKLGAIFATIAGLWLALIPTISDPLLSLLIEQVEDLTIGVLLASCLLQLVPIAALGTFSPIAIRLMLRGVASSGTTAGLIYGVNTMGSIVGTLGTVLVLIPRFGSRDITYGLAGTILLCAAMLLLISRRTKD